MSKAAKQVIIFLGVLLLVCAIALWSMFSQKTVLQEANTQLQSEIAGNKKDLAVLGQKKEELITENNNLKNEISSVTNEKDQLGGKVSDLVAQVDSLESRANAITSERNEWKQKYEKVSKQRDDAVAKLQAAETEAKRATEGTIVLSGDPDKQAENHWAQVLKEKAELSLRIEKLETDLSQTALGIEELKKKNSDLGLEISALKQQKEELERQIKRRAEIADKISIDLVREKNDKQAIGDQLSKIREENLELRASVKELGAMKIVLEKSISRLQDDKGDIEKKLAQSEVVVQDRLEDVSKLKENISQKSASDQGKAQEVMLPPIIVNGSSAGAKAASSQAAGVKVAGQVVSINQENNFVIIDLGQSAGINIGDRLSVYRGDTYVGEVEIIQVRTDISAADIKKQSMPFQAGDTVK